MRTGSLFRIGLVSALVVTTGGCTDGKTEGVAATSRPAGHPASTPASTPPSPLPSTSPEVAAALDAYRGMWADMVIASRTSDYRSPLLAQHATGSALRQIVHSLYLDHKKGLVSRGEPVLHPRVGSADLASAPMRVVVEDCADSRNWLLQKKSGGLADDTPGGNRHISADVRGGATGWKVVDFQVREVGSC